MMPVISMPFMVVMTYVSLVAITTMKFRLVVLTERGGEDGVRQQW